jgi:cephalosporin hydroxylase
MSRDFNPLDCRLLFLRPDRLQFASAWTEHTPFAMTLVELLRPRSIVELGTHVGVSFCAFCQAVAELGLQSKCYAVDTWKGDDHAGFYAEAVFADLSQYHRRYESFSRLLRMTFDEALGQIADQSLDLLHIDGLHSYEAVKHDYQTWFPKLSKRAVVLFHDTVVTRGEFGVHKFWKEISASFPNFNFNFEHGSGLGVLGVGPDLPEPVKGFFETATKNPERIRRLFSSLGGQVQRESELAARSFSLPVNGGGFAETKEKLRSHVVQRIKTAAEPFVVPSFHRLYYDGPHAWKTNTFLGLKTFECPLDLQLYQELIHQLRPSFVIRTGVAEGGALLYFATLLDLIGAPASAIVVGVDMVLSDEARRLSHPRIRLFKGSSADPDLINEIKKIVPSEGGFVSLGSDHSKENVARELALFKDFVALGSYMVAEFTNLNGNPVVRTFGPGPSEAVSDFLTENQTFAKDDIWVRNKFSFHQGGWLKRIR